MGSQNFRVGVVHKGAYAAATAYVPLDEVSYNGSTYRNKLACTGVVPTTTANWVLVSSKGDTGATGPQGPKGDTGATGPQGSAGVDASAPAGTVIYYAKSTAPVGYLKCNGAAVSRTTYASLFAVLGTTFGAGDGSTTFNIPDFRSEFIRGADDGRGIVPAAAVGAKQAATSLFDHAPFGWNSNAPAGSWGESHPVAHFEASQFDRHYFGDHVDSISSRSIDYRLISPAGVTDTMTIWSGDVRPRNIALLACIKF
jgi:microcystin-dependent protein